MRFFVIRHGETAWNVEGRFQGQKDTALNEKGLAQAATLGERLAGHSFEAVLTSPLDRAKKTAELIPLCHTLLLTSVKVELELLDEESAVRAVCSVKCDGKTGVEMEALTGASVALLTVYDMCKAVDRSMEILSVHLVEKHGGKSGDFYYGDEK